MRFSAGTSRLIKRFSLLYGMLEQMPNLILIFPVNLR